MKPIIAALLALAVNLSAQELHLPFNGRWFVMQGGDTLNVNQHMSVRAQWYGLDLMKVGGAENRSLEKTDGGKIEDYYSWGEAVISPAAGTVESAVDGLPDNPLGKKDAKHLTGNHVVIKVATNQFVFIAHLQKGSVSVKAGEQIKVGQLLGKCGNSGNSDAPHVHMHMQDTPTLNEGLGQNLIFKGINVELNGKTFETVDWPLIRGLFVWNK